MLICLVSLVFDRCVFFCNVFRILWFWLLSVFGVCLWVVMMRRIFYWKLVFYLNGILVLGVFCWKIGSFLIGLFDIFFLCLLFGMFFVIIFCSGMYGCNYELWCWLVGMWFFVVCMFIWLCVGLVFVFLFLFVCYVV